MVRHLAASVRIGTIALLGAGCAQSAEPLEFVTLSSAGAAASFDVNAGALTGLRVGERGVEMARYRPAGCVEVEDLRDQRIYAPGAWKASIRNRRMSGERGRRVLEFVQQYDAAPFTVAHAVSERPEGIRWEVALRLRDGQTLHRSVRVSWLLPLPAWWQFWVPNDTRGTTTDGGGNTVGSRP